MQYYTGTDMIILRPFCNSSCTIGKLSFNKLFFYGWCQHVIFNSHYSSGFCILEFSVQHGRCIPQRALLNLLLCQSSSSILFVHPRQPDNFTTSLFTGSNNFFISCKYINNLSICFYPFVSLFHLVKTRLENADFERLFL